MKDQVENLVEANKNQLPKFNKFDPDSIVCAIKTLRDPETVWDEKMILGVIMTDKDRKQVEADAKKKKEDEKKTREMVDKILKNGGPMTCD